DRRPRFDLLLIREHDRSMKNYMVTVMAADQVGIVQSVTGTIGALGGNVSELSQTVMRGYFTIILAVSVPKAIDPGELEAAIAEQGRRFRLTVKALEAEENRRAPVADGDRFIL